MLTGTVTLYDSDEGWGAIRPDGPLPGGDIWFHFAAIEMSGFRELSAGDRGERGFATYWDETTLTERVTVSYRDTAKTVPVASGYFLAVFWDDVSGDDFGSGDQPEWKTA